MLATMAEEDDEEVEAGGGQVRGGGVVWEFALFIFWNFLCAVILSWLMVLTNWEDGPVAPACTVGVEFNGVERGRGRRHGTARSEIIWREK